MFNLKDLLASFHLLSSVAYVATLSVTGCFESEEAFSKNQEIWGKILLFQPALNVSFM